MGLLSNLFGGAGGGASPAMGAGSQPPIQIQMPQQPNPFTPEAIGPAKQGMPMQAGMKPQMGAPQQLMPQSQMRPQMGMPPQGGMMPPPANPNSIPGGPALGWRPKSAGQINQEINGYLAKDSVKNLMENNTYFNKLYKNLEPSMQVKLLGAGDTLHTSSQYDKELGRQYNPTPAASPTVTQPQGMSMRPMPQTQGIQPGQSGQSYMSSLIAPGQGPIQRPMGNSYMTPAPELGKLSQLNPEFQQPLMNTMDMMHQKGWSPTMAEGLRTPEQQAEKVRMGYSNTMNSNHLTGNAADVVDRNNRWSMNPQTRMYAQDLRETVGGDPNLKSGASWKKFGPLGDFAHIQYQPSVTGQPARPMSQQGLEPPFQSNASTLIKGFEGYSPKAYGDYKQNSIGYGTKAAYPGQQMNKAQATAAMNKYIANDEKVLNSLVKVPLEPNQKAALQSLMYNIGQGAFARSTVLKKLNAGDYQGAADAFNKFNKAGGKTHSGLVERRAKERAVFLGQ